MVSIKDKQRTNFSEGEWASCKSVTLRDGVLYCSLEPKRTYVLTEAYEDDLHIRFANASKDDDLIAFVRGWGPLYLPNRQIPANGVVCLPLNHCRAYQRWIKALLEILTAFKQAEREQEALLAFLEAEQENQLPDEPVSFMLLRGSFSIAGDVVDWVKSANISTVQGVIRRLIPFSSATLNGVNLACSQQGEKRRLEASWEIPDMQSALRWMIWYDEFTMHPVVCCPECRKVFRGENTRVRKYCSEKCGHNATARRSMKKKRNAERTERK